MGSVLGIGGGAFVDQFVVVEESFLKQHNLAKGDNNIASEEVVVATHAESIKMARKFNHWTPGGSCLNVIKFLNIFGNECTYQGMIGDDEKGKKISELLVSSGIHPILTTAKGLNTPIANCFVTYDKSHRSERTIQACFGAVIKSSADQIDPANFKKKDLICLEGYVSYHDNFIQKAIATALESNTTISLDLSSTPTADIMKGPKFLESVRKANFLFGNFEEMKAFTGKENVAEMVKFFDVRQTVCITNGAEGVYLKPKNSEIVKPFKAEEIAQEKVIDTTGAGDAYQAGFLDGMLRKLAIEECVAHGQITASKVIQVIGTDLDIAQQARLKKELKIPTP